MGRKIIFSKKDDQILVRDGLLLEKRLVPYREVELGSRKISFDGDVHLMDIEILGNNNNFAPGVYQVLFAKNLQGLEECQYDRVDLSNFPVLKDLNILWKILFE